MSFKNSLADSEWATKFQTAIYPHTSEVDLTTNYVEDLNDSLVIEDLEISSSSVRTSLSTGKNHYDFDEQIPGVISEACTKNNLYILVRVPTNHKQLVNTTSSFSQTTPKMSEVSPCSRFSVKRDIFPILEEDVASSNQETQVLDTKTGHPKSTCWTKNNESKEEFSSTTNIICEEIPCMLPNQVPDPTENQEFVVPINNNKRPVRCQNEIELQELNLNSNHFTGPTNVSLENYGILITPTKMPKTDNLLVFQVDTEAKEKQRSNGSSCFQWLRKLFHIKQRKSGLVHAKVYKTYFVKWKKCSEECSCPKQIYANGQKLRRYSA